MSLLNKAIQNKPAQPSWKEEALIIGDSESNHQPESMLIDAAGELGEYYPNGPVSKYATPGFIAEPLKPTYLKYSSAKAQDEYSTGVVNDKNWAGRDGSSLECVPYFMGGMAS
jgi:hypothetical protein